jgi:hypothetical protein
MVALRHVHRGGRHTTVDSYTQMDELSVFAGPSELKKTSSQ